MREKVHANQAAKQRAYRRRLREQGKSTSGSPNLERLQKWIEANGKSRGRSGVRPFVAIDTEGIGRKPHKCVLLGDSDGRFVEDYKKGLSTKDAFDFLLGCPRNAILVGYSIGYDVNMILRDCGIHVLNRLADGLPATQTFDGVTYRFQWFPGKSFSLSLLDERKSAVKSVCVYDVFGFFQKSFVATAEEFQVLTKEEKEFIAGMKNTRASFRADERVRIREYNALECKVLVRIMDSLRDSMRIANCVPERWHGAGAIAATLLKRNGIKDENYDSVEMQKYFLGSYFGGRIQPLQMGEFEGVYTHDIISAYPSFMRLLPSAVGTWNRVHSLCDNPWALYVVRWDIKKGIGPFPVRANVNGVRTINYPLRGKGIYYAPEVQEAKRVYGRDVEILYGFRFAPSKENVFRWIEELFESRKRFKNSDNVQERQAQLPIKLGINSLYGKCAQGQGYLGAKPAYQNYFWAGWITSSTRAAMFRLASKTPDSIIAFATDGVFSSTQLAEEGKQLGEWEVDHSPYLFLLKAGLYAFGKSDDLRCKNEGGNKKDCETLCHHTTAKSRGHFMRDIDWTDLQRLWREKGQLAVYEYTTQKFFGLKVSLASKDYTKKWRRWLNVPRVINFFPSNQMVEHPECVLRSQRLFSYSCDKPSLPYEPKGDWYEGEEGLNYLDELDQLDSFI